MTDPVIHNFRGARVLVVHPDDANRQTLATVLQRLGLRVTLAEQGGQADPRDGEDFDIVFFDADQGLGRVLGNMLPADATYIALIGMEAPGRLSRVVRQRCASYLMKPIRTSGVFAALFIGVNESSRRKREARELEAMAERLAGRRLVTKAVVRLMAKTGLDDEEAYRVLRRESMSRRLSLEAYARDRLGADLADPPQAGTRSA